MSAYRPGMRVWVATKEDEEAAAAFLTRHGYKRWEAVCEEPPSEPPGGGGERDAPVCAEEGA